MDSCKDYCKTFKGRSNGILWILLKWILMGFSEKEN